jgi:hypothetical protein
MTADDGIVRIEIHTARVVPLLHHRLDMVLDLDLAPYRHHHSITAAADIHAPLLHHHQYLLPDTVAVLLRTITTIFTIMVAGRPWEDTTIGMHLHMDTSTIIMIFIEEDLDVTGVGVIGRTTMRMVVELAVIVVECIGMRRIRRQDLAEVEIETSESEIEIVLVTFGCYSTTIMRSSTVRITIIIGGTETKTGILLVNIIIIILLLLVLEVEKEVRAVVEGAVLGVTAEMEDGVDGCARTAESEIIEDPAGEVEETTYTERTRDTIVSQEPKSLDLADGIAMKIT